MQEEGGAREIVLRGERRQQDEVQIRGFESSSFESLLARGRREVRHDEGRRERKDLDEQHDQVGRGALRPHRGTDWLIRGHLARWPQFPATRDGTAGPARP